MMKKLQRLWERFWMSFAGSNRSGRFAARLASIFAPPYMARFYLARLGRKGYIDPRAQIHHDDLVFGPRAFVADRVVIYQASGGGKIELSTRAHVMRDCVLETGQKGSIHIGEDTFLHPRCQVMAYVGDIRIGNHVAVAPNCAFYSYNHGMEAGDLIKKQALTTKGGITVGDGAWLGYGVIVLDGVSIGDGAVVGAGSVVTANVAPMAIVAGNPAKVISSRQ